MSEVAPLRAPLVSVVMSVYNGAPGLPGTIESVLGQKGCDFELIVVDDGSTDGSGQILDSIARGDGRMHVVHQSNSGLTAALIRGCALARGDFIARQDADDLSLPGRLALQSGFLASHRDVVAVAGRVRFLAPGGEWLFDHEAPDVIEIQLDIDRIRTPPLVGAMFRREAYESVGGFRKEFPVAQDVDLWLRLVEHGACRGLSQECYEARLTMGGISSRARAAQFELARLAIECAKKRRSGADDRPLLEQRNPPVRDTKPIGRREKARFNYFIGSCLNRHDRKSARNYFRSALRDDPTHLKALIRWVVA